MGTAEIFLSVHKCLIFILFINAIKIIAIQGHCVLPTHLRVVSENLTNKNYAFL